MSNKSQEETHALQQNSASIRSPRRRGRAERLNERSAARMRFEWSGFACALTSVVLDKQVLRLRGKIEVNRPVNRVAIVSDNSHQQLKRGSGSIATKHVSVMVGHPGDTKPQMMCPWYQVNKCHVHVKKALGGMLRGLEARPLDHSSSKTSSCTLVFMPFAAYLMPIMYPLQLWMVERP
jgi:hypothetical protein